MWTSHYLSPHCSYVDHNMSSVCEYHFSSFLHEGGAVSPVLCFLLRKLLVAAGHWMKTEGTSSQLGIDWLSSTFLQKIKQCVLSHRGRCCAVLTSVVVPTRARLEPLYIMHFFCAAIWITVGCGKLFFFILVRKLSHHNFFVLHLSHLY